jgi:hypothetical protein
MRKKKQIAKIKKKKRAIKSRNKTENLPSLAGLEKIFRCDTYGGVVHVEWDAQEAVTPIGQLVFFAQFLKQCNLFDHWVKDCPPIYSNNCETKLTNLLGTLLLSTLAGHKRYAHITSIRQDTVNPPLLGMTKIMSEDSVRRAFQKVEAVECENWQKQHLRFCYDPLLKENWILDIDTTVKSLYGNQEGAEVGYNPQKPGRPAHIIHSYMMAETRLFLDSEVLPGKQSASSYTLPGLLSLLDSMTPEERPTLIRGDCAFGNEKFLSAIESRNVDYLFKLRKTKGVKRLIQLLDDGTQEWKDAGQGWEGIASSLKLSGWKKNRRVVVLRRYLRGKRNKKDKERFQLFFEGFTPKKTEIEYEYSILVTSVDETKIALIKSGEKNIEEVKIITEKSLTPLAAATINTGFQDSVVFTLAQLYRDRATCENNFDELKNQWGWGGFVTQDLKRSQIMARIVAQIYNWWTLFVRWIDPDKHREGITSRPLMLYGVARQVVHGSKTTLKLTHMHGKGNKIHRHISLIQKFLKKLKEHAEQILSKATRFRLILSEIFKKFLKGRLLKGENNKNEPKFLGIPVFEGPT